MRERPRRLTGMTMWPLTRSTAAGSLKAYKVALDATNRTPPPELPVHEGRDWIYVLSGRLRLLLGDEEFVITPGETAEFSCWTPHWFGVVEEAVECLMIIGPQGERLHLRD